MMNIRTLLLIISFVTLFTAARAQKLPNVQTENMHAPAGIKVDGKTTEWNNQFRAFNHATEVYYTISNDNKNLYLTVQAKDQTIINKIINGGVTFTINNTGKKKDKDGMSITYPVFDRRNKPFFGAQSKLAAEKGSFAVTGNADSLMNVHNKILGDKSKLIGVTGIPGIDTLISVYNTDGIKATGLFDNKGAYTCEFAISLKNLGLAMDNPAKFAYHITLNGASLFDMMNFKSVSDDGKAVVINTSTTSFTTSDNGILSAKIMLNGQSSAPTDFWGEYTLAK